MKDEKLKITVEIITDPVNEKGTSELNITMVMFNNKLAPTHDDAVTEILLHSTLQFKNADTDMDTMADSAKSIIEATLKIHGDRFGS